MKKHLNSIFSLIFLTALLILPYFVFAKTTSATDTSLKGRLQTVAEKGGYKVDGNVDLLTMAGLIINSILGLVGAIFIVLMILAGFQWMTAAGNEQKTEKALSMIKTAVIGLIIVLAAYSITYFVFTYLPFSGTGATTTE